VSTSTTALILFAHGSSVESANEAVREVGRQMAQAAGWLVEAAFLDGGTPDLPGSVAALVARGVDRVVIVPYFLTSGLHLQRDLPKLVRDVMASHQNLRVHVTPPLDGHSALVDILLDRAASALAEGGS
jgi:sirohydrochlorin ferrochelatase